MHSRSFEDFIRYQRPRVNELVVGGEAGEETFDHHEMLKGTDVVVVREGGGEGGEEGGVGDFGVGLLGEEEFDAWVQLANISP
jgi:hypothetical protein